MKVELNPIDIREIIWCLKIALYEDSKGAVPVPSDDIRIQLVTDMDKAYDEAMAEASSRFKNSKRFEEFKIHEQNCWKQQDYHMGLIKEHDLLQQQLCADRSSRREFPS